MRHALRRVSAIVAAIFAVLGASCAGDGTGVSHSGVAQLQLGQVFQQSASTQVDATVVKARVVIRLVSASPPSVLIDVQRNLGSQSGNASLDVKFPLQGEGALYDVEVHGFNAAGEAIYHAGPIQFSESSLKGGNVTVEANVVYVGPGSDATAVNVSPSPLIITAGTTSPLTAQAFGPGNTPIPRALFEWRVVGGSNLISVDDNGVVTAGNLGGTATVEVRVPSAINPKTTVDVHVRATPSQIVLVSGGGQTGPAGGTLPNPIVVRAVSSNGANVPGAIVTFSPAAGSVDATTAITDEFGLAQTSWTLGANTGAQTLTATVQGVAQGVQITATATSAPLTLTLESGGGQTGNVLQSLGHPVVVRLMQGTTPVAGTNVSFLAGQGGLASSGVVATNAEGRAQVNWTLGPAVGAQTLSVTVAGAAGSPLSVGATATPGSFIIRQPLAVPSALTPGQPSTISVQVVSSPGLIPISGVSVTFSAGATTGNTFTPVTGISNANGVVSTTFVSTDVGVKPITASSGSVVSVVTNLPVAIANNTGAAIVKVSGDNQQVHYGQNFGQLHVIRVLDSRGDPVPNAFVDWGTANGEARGVTDANGLASLQYFLPNDPVTYPVNQTGMILVRLVSNPSIIATFFYVPIP